MNNVLTPAPIGSEAYTTTLQAVTDVEQWFKVHVTQLAKWKTTLQMTALGVLLAGPAGDRVFSGVTLAGTLLPPASGRLRRREFG